jgi:hypothetical protein
MYSIGQTIYETATAEVKRVKDIPCAIGAGTVITGTIYGLGVTALAISSKVFAAILTTTGFSSLAARIALPLILTNPWVIVAITIGIPAVMVLINATKKQEALEKKPTFIEFDVELDKEIIQFARDELKKHSNLSPTLFPKKYQPVNAEINNLHSLYNDYYSNFLKELKTNYLQDTNNNPWDHEIILDAADKYLKIAYAISCLTLEDLPAFTDNIPKTMNVNITYEFALVDQNSYQYRSFFYCSQIYHQIRGGIDYKQMILMNFEGDIPKEHANKFYQFGTRQNKWNAIYNNYCARIRQFVTDTNLKKQDSRHFKWTQQDQLLSSGEMTFKRTPDTLPT